MNLFFLKKILTALVMPINISLLLFLLAIVLFKRRAKWSFNCLIAGFTVLLLSSFAPTANWYMSQLENQYMVYNAFDKTPIDYIVILGCKHTTDKRLPVLNQLHPCSLQRLTEAVRIFRHHPEAKIITSGYATGGNKFAHAIAIKKAAIALGVPESHIINENFTSDTEEEAQLIAPRIANTHALLVTNADHMPRALKYFNHYGAFPTPAPAGFWVKGLARKKNAMYYFPSAEKLQQTTRAWYETLGQIVQWLKQL